MSENFKNKNMWFVLFLVIFSVSLFVSLPLHKYFFPCDSPRTVVPWYFIRQHYIAGLCAMAGLVVSLLVAFIIRKKYEYGAFWLMWMAIVLFSWKVVEVAMINAYCSYVLDISRASTNWKDFDTFITTLVKWDLIYFFIVFPTLILLSVIYRWQRKKSLPPSEPWQNFRKVVVILIAGLLIIYLGFRSITSRRPISPMSEKESAVSLYYKSKALDNQGKEVEALAMAEKSIKLDPNFAKAHLQLSYLYNKKENAEKAIEEANKALQLGLDNVNKAVAYANIAIGYSYLGQYDKAISYSTQAIQLDPHDCTTSYITLGQIYRKKEEPQKAIEYFKAAIKCEGCVYCKPTAHFDLGLTYLVDMKSYDQAIAEFQQTLALAPAYNDAYFQLATAYIFKNDLDSANKVYEKLKGKDKNLAEELKKIIDSPQRETLLQEKYKKELLREKKTDAAVSGGEKLTQ